MHLRPPHAVLISLIGLAALPLACHRESPPDFAQLCRYLAERSPQPMVAAEGATHIVRYANPAFCQLAGTEAAHLSAGLCCWAGHAFCICQELTQRKTWKA